MQAMGHRSSSGEKMRRPIKVGGGRSRGTVLRHCVGRSDPTG